MNAAVIALAAASAVCEMFGTVTVWRTYRRSVAAGDRIRSVLQMRIELEDAMARDPRESLYQSMQRWADPVELQRAKDEMRAAIRNAAEPLKADRWTSAGLAAFVLEAVLGFVAVVVASS